MKNVAWSQQLAEYKDKTSWITAASEKLQSHPATSSLLSSVLLL